MVNKPTVEELHDFYMEDYIGDALFEEVDEKADPSWRHGCYMSTVFKRLSDDTFWNVNWQKSGDGECNTFREKEIDSSNICQVFPHKVIKISYKSTP